MDRGNPIISNDSMSRGARTDEVGFGTAGKKAVPLLVAVLASLAGYVVTGYLLMAVIAGQTDGTPPNEWSTAGTIAVLITFAIHFILVLIGSALLGRRLGAPAPLTVAATASILVGGLASAWLMLVVYPS